MSQQGLRRRVQELAKDISDCVLALRDVAAVQQNADDLRELLRLHKQAKRENAKLREWAVRIDAWHTEICKEIGIKPVHPAGCLLKPKKEVPNDRA